MDENRSETEIRFPCFRENLHSPVCLLSSGIHLHKSKEGSGYASLQSHQIAPICIVLFLSKYKTNLNVALSDPGAMKFVYRIGQCPCNWRTTMHWNVVPTTFHTQHVCHHAWTTVKTTLWCFIVLQLLKTVFFYFI